MELTNFNNLIRDTVTLSASSVACCCVSVTYSTVHYIRWNIFFSKDNISRSLSVSTTLCAHYTVCMDIGNYSYAK